MSASALVLAALVWQGSTEVAGGPGVRGPWQQNDSRYDYVDDPTVTMDDRGEVSVAWVDQRRKDVFFRRMPDGAAVNVSRSPATFSWLPRMALAPEDPGRVFVLWQEIVFSGGSHGGDILFARSDDGGATFSAPVNLSNSIAGDGKGRITRDVWHNGSLDLVAGANGALYAAWTEYEGALWLRRSTDGGNNFSAPLKLNDKEARPARAPSLALGAGGAVYLAWTVGEDPSADIRVATSADGGASFGAPRIVARSEAYSDAPKLAVGPCGVLHVVFSENRHVMHARSEDGGRTFGPTRAISGAGAGFPALGMDAEGTLYATWERFPARRERPRGLGFAVSRDGGRSFTPPGTVPDSADPGGGANGSHQGLLMRKLAVNAKGAVAIVNSSLKDNQRSRVWLIRGAKPPP